MRISKTKLAEEIASSMNLLKLEEDKRSNVIDFTFKPHKLLHHLFWLFFFKFRVHFTDFIFFDSEVINMSNRPAKEEVIATEMDRQNKKK